MPVFDILCAQIGDEVAIQFSSEPEPRGNPEYRGFACENESACEQAGVACQLYSAHGFRPFDVKDAFEFFNS